MEFLYSYIREIVIFVFVANLICNIYPSEQLKKYIRMLVGLLLIIMMFKPLISGDKILEKVDLSIDDNIDRQVDIQDKVMEYESKIESRIINENQESGKDR